MLFCVSHNFHEFTCSEWQAQSIGELPRCRSTRKGYENNAQEDGGNGNLHRNVCGEPAAQIRGSGTSGTVLCFTSTTAIGDSLIAVSGSNVGIGTAEA